MWGQSEIFIAACIQHIRHKKIQAPGRPPVLTPHHPPTLEASTLPTKKCLYKNFTQLDFLPLELLHKIYMWHEGLVHHNQLKPVVVKITQHHPVLSASTAYDLKFVPFDYYTHYDHIKYAWADTHKCPHNNVTNGENNKLSNMSPSNFT